MILGKLIGYDPATKAYTDSQSQITNLPKPAFIVSTTTLPADYEDYGTTPEAWHLYGQPELGSVTGFKDWMSLRAIIQPLILAIAGNDYSTFDNLNTIQKHIALTYFPTKIIQAQGLTFYATKCGGIEAANNNIQTYVNVLAKKAREQRYAAYMNFGIAYLGLTQGLKAESYLREDFLDVVYKDRGVLYLATDGLDGLGNWTISDNGYTTTGLKARIDSAEFVLTGITTEDFINTMIGIIENGTY